MAANFPQLDVDGERQVKRLLRRIEQKITAIACPNSEEAEQAAMKLVLIFDYERSWISRICSMHWACICSTCSERFAEMILLGNEYGKIFACEALAALSQVSEFSRGIVIDTHKVFEGLLHGILCLKASDKKVAFATLSAISLHCERGSFAIVALRNALPTFAGLLSSGDPEIKKEVSDLLNNCAYFSERAALLIAEEEGVITSLLSMCKPTSSDGTSSCLEQKCVRGSSIGALNSLSMYPAVAPRLAAAGAVSVVEALRNTSFPPGLTIQSREERRVFDELRGSAAEAQMVVANLSVHCDVGSALFCTDDVLQSIVHFAGFAVAGQNYDALHGEALWLVKGCLLPLSRLLRCERNLARLTCLESAGGEDGTWRSGHVARVIVGQLLQNWLEQTRRDRLAADCVFSADDASGRPDWMRKSLRLLPDDVSIGLAVLDAMVAEYQVQPQCKTQISCGSETAGCIDNHFLGPLRSEDGATRMLRTRRATDVDNIGYKYLSALDDRPIASTGSVTDKCTITKFITSAETIACHDEDGKREDQMDRKLSLRELLWAVADEPAMQMHRLCVDVLGEALASAAMRPRLLALTMGHHNRLGAGFSGRRCWLRELDANLLAEVARASCTISVYAAALAHWIFPPQIAESDASMLCAGRSAHGAEARTLRQNVAEAAEQFVERGFKVCPCKAMSLDDSPKQENPKPAKRRG